MSVVDKIKKTRLFFQRFDVLKTLYWRRRLHLPRAFSMHVCPQAIVSVDKSAKVEVGQGEFVINDS